MSESTRKITTSLEGWDFQTQHVQNHLTGGDFVGSHGCVLCATAPRLEDLSGGDAELLNDPGDESATANLNRTIAIPIGVIDTATIQQNRQVAQIFELGSKRSYILSARTVSQMSLARVFYKGASLLRMLYAYYPEKVAQGLNNEVISGSYGNLLRDNTKDAATQFDGTPIEIDQWLIDRLPTIKDNPGYNNVWFNLASDVFSQPTGLILFMKDNNKSDVAAIFLEECNVQTHGLSISANSVVLAENTSIMFERIVPIKVKIDEYQSTQNDSSGFLQDATNALGLGGLV